MHWSVGIAIVAVFVSGCASDQSLKLRAEDVDRGRVDFLEHCASCHGRAARGDGRIADMFSIAMPDLTELTLRNSGKFPTKYVRWAIDGRADIIAHGPREMPVWGNEFRHEQGMGDLPALRTPDEDTKARIEDLIEYLRSAQRLDDI